MRKILFIFVLALPMFTAIAQNNENIEKFVTGAYYAETMPRVQATPDGYFAVNEGRSIVKYDFVNSSFSEIIFDASKIEGAPEGRIHSFSFCDDGSKMLIAFNAQRIYRRSYVADYYVYNINYKELKPLDEGGKQRDAIFSPNGWMVAYVRDNNLYIKKLRYNSISPVTTDGELNRVINGACDWVYEEEFATPAIFSWSPDSKELAYVRFDESDVPEFSFPMYAASNPDRPDNKLYPGSYTYKYPKAGEKNSKVEVKVFNVDKRVSKTMQLGDGKDFYIPRIYWTGGERQLAIFKLNRRQNELSLLITNTASTVSNEIFTDRNKCYIDEFTYSKVLFLPDGKGFIYMGELDGRTHLYHYAINGVQQGCITKGDFDVTNLLGYNELTSTVYYEAAAKSPLKREVYSYNIKTRQTLCLTADDGYNQAVLLSSDRKYLITDFSSAQLPNRVDVRNTFDGKVVRNIISNNNFDAASILRKQFITLKAADNATDLNGWVVYPANFDSNQKYPLVLFQYSGPGSQEVLDNWDYGWEQALAQAGYIVACFDPRGTGARGENFKKCTYQKLGLLESDDQIAIAKQLSELNYIDANRIGIYGWSFGGSMAATCLIRSDIFKTAIAVAPVTSWRFYDTVYAERFMRKPDENISGYDNYSTFGFFDHQPHGRLFLVHGSADDNVHQQNQLELVDFLVQKNVQFDMFVYPNRNHSIYGGNTRRHLFNMMYNYFVRNL
ncbi:MAG: S9 family peptidase [Bacteroidales bacterium]|nr:S9 family peptidase [Bacteroidales bacterium]